MTANAETTVAPDEIDEHFAPRVRADVGAIAVGDDTVLLAWDTSTVLNPIGALVWQFLDGGVTLAELVDDFSETLDADRRTVRDDIVEFARALGRSGLLEGVAERPDLPEIEWEEPERLDVGDLLEPFTLPDLGGTDRSLEEWRGRQLLLVHWSAGCGYCLKIAADLASTEPGLAAHDIDLLLVTSGDPDATRDVLADAGVRAPALVKGNGVDPFQGLGTPVAYLLDADGRVAAPMAYGAKEVPRLATDLAGVELTEEVASPPVAAPDDRDEVQYLPAAGEVCGPGGGSGPDSTTWAGTRAYRVGAFHVGVRYNSVETAEVLDRLFAGAAVDDRRAPDNYSVALYPSSARRSRKLNLLVQGRTQLVRSRSAARPLAALLSYVSADVEPLDANADDSLLHVRATAAVRDGQAMLLPGGLVHFLKELQPRLARRGIVLVDAPDAVVDAGSRELVVPEPGVPHDAAVLTEIDEGTRLGAELPYVRPGRYPLTDWYLWHRDDAIGPLSRAVAVAAAYRSVKSLDEPTHLGETLAGVFEHVRAHGVWTEHPESLDTQLDVA